MIHFEHTTPVGTSKVTCSQSIIKLGKDSRCDIILASGCRMHAVIEQQGEDRTIIDLGNDPKTKVNGVEINKYKINVGDEIQIGVDKLKVISDSEESSKPLVDITKKTFMPSPANEATTHVSFPEFPFTEPNTSHQILRVDSEAFNEVIAAIHQILRVDSEAFNEVIAAIISASGTSTEEKHEERVRHALHLWAKLLNEIWVIREVAYKTIETLIRANNYERAIKMVKDLKKDRPFRTFSGMWKQLNKK